MTAGLVMAIGGVVASAPPAGAVLYSGEPIWVPRRPANPDASRADNTALAKIGNVVYVGGDFTELAPTEGVPAGLTRNALVAVNAQTGVPVPTFAPVLDGIVEALVAADDGSVLYVGGTFTTVNGQPVGGFAILDPATGALAAGVTQRPTDGEVAKLRLAGTKLYVGGIFNRIGGVRRSSIARLDLTNPAVPAVDAFAPAISGGVVDAIDVPPDGSRVYVGGRFDTLDLAFSYKLIAFDPATAAVIGAFAPNPPAKQPVFDVLALNDRVFVAYGGGYNRFVQMDLTGAAQFISCGDGDVQALHLIGTTLLVGGHFTGAPKKNCPYDVLSTARVAKYDVSGATPVIAADTGMPLVWANELGVWKFLGTSLDDLWLAGDFQRFGNRPTGGVAHWVNPAAYKDSNPPSTPGGVTVTGTTPGSISVSWSPSTDNKQVVGYYVLVDGVIDATTTGTSVTAAGLDPSRTYSVQVEAFDVRLNLSVPSLAVSATTGPDVTPPQAPTGFRLVDGSTSALTIAWNPAVDDGSVRSYDVYRGALKVGSTSATTYADSGLPANATIGYSVVAVDAGGNRSARSATFAARTYTVIAGTGATWKYSDKGSLPDLLWRQSAYDDSTWASGSAPLGYGTSGIATTVGYGANPAKKYLTTYARRTFNLADPTGVTGITVYLKADDCAAIFLNGRLLMNDNCPAALDPDMEALTDRTGPSQEIWREYRVPVPTGALVAGTNWLAAEIHQSAGDSPDLFFDAEVQLGLPPGTPDVTPPGPPGTPVVTGHTTTTISLSWAPATDDVGVVAYQVLRFGSIVATIPGTSITDPGLTPATSYTYVIRALDSAGNAAESAPVTASTDAVPVALLPASATWSYTTAKVDLGTTWRSPSYTPSAPLWSTGKGVFGFGLGGETTVLPRGGTTSATKILTWYFRTNVTVASPGSLGTVKMSLVRDDGAVVYVNGVEVYRSNLPAGGITAATKATKSLGSGALKAVTFNVPGSAFVAGDNVIAVELHNASVTNADARFLLSSN